VFVLAVLPWERSKLYLSIVLFIELLLCFAIAWFDPHNSHVLLPILLFISIACSTVLVLLRSTTDKEHLFPRETQRNLHTRMYITSVLCIPLLLSLPFATTLAEWEIGMYLLLAAIGLLGGGLNIFPDWVFLLCTISFAVPINISNGLITYCALWLVGLTSDARLVSKSLAVIVFFTVLILLEHFELELTVHVAFVSNLISLYFNQQANHMVSTMFGLFYLFVVISTVLVYQLPQYWLVFSLVLPLLVLASVFPLRIKLTIAMLANAMLFVVSNYAWQNLCIVFGVLAIHFHVVLAVNGKVMLNRLLFFMPLLLVFAYLQPKSMSVFVFVLLDSYFVYYTQPSQKEIATKINGML
jgi:hypothetical protein